MALADELEALFIDLAATLKGSKRRTFIAK